MSWKSGERVRVQAGQGEGSDRDWNGRVGSVVRDHGNGWVEILFDSKPAHWPRWQTTIVHHNVKPE